MADMMSCTMDAIGKNDYIDAERVAVVGGSHGGEMLRCYVTRLSSVYSSFLLRTISHRH